MDFLLLLEFTSRLLQYAPCDVVLHQEVELETYAVTNCYGGRVDSERELCVGGKLDKPMVGVYAKSGSTYALVKTYGGGKFDFYGYKVRQLYCLSWTRFSLCTKCSTVDGVSKTSFNFYGRRYIPRFSAEYNRFRGRP